MSVDTGIPEFPCWCVLHLHGGARLAGYATEVELLGRPGLHIAGIPGWIAASAYWHATQITEAHAHAIARLSEPIGPSIPGSDPDDDWPTFGAGDHQPGPERPVTTFDLERDRVRWVERVRAGMRGGG